MPPASLALSEFPCRFAPCNECLCISPCRYRLLINTVSPPLTGQPVRRVCMYSIPSTSYEKYLYSEPRPDLQTCRPAALGQQSLLTQSETTHPLPRRRYQTLPCPSPGLCSPFSLSHSLQLCANMYFPISTSSPHPCPPSLFPLHNFLSLFISLSLSLWLLLLANLLSSFSLSFRLSPVSHLVIHSLLFMPSPTLVRQLDDDQRRLWR